MITLQRYWFWSQCLHHLQILAFNVYIIIRRLVFDAIVQLHAIKVIKAEMLSKYSSNATSYKVKHDNQWQELSSSSALDKTEHGISLSARTWPRCQQRLILLLSQAEEGVQKTWPLHWQERSKAGSRQLKAHRCNQWTIFCTDVETAILLIPFPEINVFRKYKREQFPLSFPLLLHFLCCWNHIL